MKKTNLAEGSRATIIQGQVFRHQKIDREIISGPAYRLIFDHSTNVAYSALAGGSSGRRFSQFYYSDLSNWYFHRYKNSTAPWPKPKIEEL